jgi:hypothetical protein
MSLAERRTTFPFGALTRKVIFPSVDTSGEADSDRGFCGVAVIVTESSRSSATLQITSKEF